MPGLDADTKLLMHMDGADGGTTFPDASLSNPKGNATVVAPDVNTRTATKKWGPASAEFDGDSGLLSYADDADWDLFGSDDDDWTVDCWIKLGDHVGEEGFVGQYEDSSEYWSFQHEHGFGVGLKYKTNNVTEINMAGGEITDLDWHHVAFIKVGNKYAVYVDGTQVDYATITEKTNTFAAVLSIGARSAGVKFYEGFIDELRIQHSNIFGANPNDTPDDTIDVPTGPYSEGDEENALMFAANF